MSYNLFLDDIRMPYEAGNYMYPVELRAIYRLEQWVIVRSYDSFVKYITTNGLPYMVSFDHDIADSHYESDFKNIPELYDTMQEKTGYDCAKWLWQKMVDEENYTVRVLCHSMNPVGRENIINVFKYQ